MEREVYFFLSSLRCYVSDLIIAFAKIYEEKKNYLNEIVK